jgi:hypothetical protein
MGVCVNNAAAAARQATLKPEHAHEIAAGSDPRRNASQPVMIADAR